MKMFQDLTTFGYLKISPFEYPALKDKTIKQIFLGRDGEKWNF